MKEGEWNDFEIRIVGDSAEFHLYGEKVKTAKPKPEATPFGIRAEFGAIQIRHIRIKETK